MILDRLVVLSLSLKTTMILMISVSMGDCLPRLLLSEKCKLLVFVSFYFNSFLGTRVSTVSMGGYLVGPSINHCVSAYD